MGYERTVKCDVCGTVFLTDRANKARCSRKCSNIAANRAKRERERINKIEHKTDCPHNSALLCYKRNCGSCGWNPVVEQMRKEARSNG